MEYNYNNGYQSRDGQNNFVFLTDEALGIPSFDHNDVKKTSSKIFISLFVYLLIVNGLMLIMSLVLGVVIGLTENESLNELVSGYTFSVIASSIVQYLIAFPIFFLMVRSTGKAGVYAKEKLSVKEYLLFLLIGEGLMLLGSMIGSFVSEFIGGFFGITTENSLDAIVFETPIWLIIISVCILGPIFEELIYRKLIMDRFGRLGGAVAVILSSIAFALMHCNLYQFFYALAIGIVFGYVYEKTHNIIYTITMHMILNFYGSVAVLPIAKLSDEVVKMLEIIEAGGNVDEASFLIKEFIVLAYSGLQMALMIGGIVALVLYVKRQRHTINATLERPKRGLIGTALSSAGAITFIIFCSVLTLINLFTGA